MVGFVRGFGENTRAVQEAIARGELRKIYFAKVSMLRRWGNPGSWFSDKKRSGGGPAIDLGVHVIDLVRFLTGRQIPRTHRTTRWANVGDIGKVVSQLEDIHEFLGRDND